MVMKKLLSVSLLVLSSLLICGCEKTMFGVPESQWNQLNKEQQDEVIRGYNEQQRIKQQNAVFMSAIDTAGSIIKNNP